MFKDYDKLKICVIPKLFHKADIFVRIRYVREILSYEDDKSASPSEHFKLFVR